ncbi:hypothetical protein [Peribacillus saganii]|uniref:hypothetical protein n=1 Tax=Peribacillus saganii TaxID=2303992 RepID=UPI001314D3F7|nr:hypothetical protein [Peribacillus saganii]
MQERMADFELITKALFTSYEKIRLEGNCEKGMSGLREAEKNMLQALTFQLQQQNNLD